MNTADTLSGRQIAAARALVSLSQAALAEAAGMSVTSLKRMEGNSVNVPASSLPCKVTAVRHALERAGALFVPEDAVAGAGVRLKFTRSETRQIGNWEGEGGRVADDDVQ
jgi:hypothetical protein